MLRLLLTSDSKWPSHTTSRSGCGLMVNRADSHSEGFTSFISNKAGSYNSRLLIFLCVHTANCPTCMPLIFKSKMWDGHKNTPPEVQAEQTWQPQHVHHTSCLHVVTHVLTWYPRQGHWQSCLIILSGVIFKVASSSVGLCCTGGWIGMYCIARAGR